MFIFHHIPKTAGSTFNHAVCDANVGASLMVGAGGLSSRPDDDLSSVRFLCGHVTFAEATARGLDCDNIHASILRDPLKRIVSHFEMAFRDDVIFRDEICAIDKWGFGFEVFYEKFIVFPKLTNLHCQYLSKRASFYDAILTISEKFHIVGSVDRFDDFVVQSMTHFDSLNLGKPKSFPERNRSSLGEDFTRLIDPALLARIERDNAEDFRLWRWLNERHDGLFVRGQDHT